MSMNDAERARWLLDRGVDPQAFRTTLKLCGNSPIHDYLMSDINKTKVTALSPTGKARPADCSFVLDLMCKELLLSGRNAAIFDLIQVHTALFKDTDAAVETLAMLNTVDFIAIRSFYTVEWGKTGYFTAEQQDEFQFWAHTRLRSGHHLLLESDLPLAETECMWPSRFVSLLLSDCRLFGVAKVVRP